MYLHIRDYLEHLSPGGLVGVSSDRALFRALARVSSRAAARSIFDTVGENGLLALSADALALLAGIPASTAGRIVAARELGELLLHAMAPRLSQSSDVLRHLPLGLATLEFEVLFGIALSANLEVKAVVLLAKGGTHSAAITPKDLFVPLVRLNATGVILVHNHPSGDRTPSKEDVAFTNHATRAGRLLGINVVDHLVVTRAGVTSFAESGLLLSEREFGDETTLHEMGGAQ